MGQLLKACTTLPEDLGSSSSTHIRWLTTVYNSSFRRPDAFGFSGHQLSNETKHHLRHTHTHTPKQNKKQIKRVYKHRDFPQLLLSGSGASQ